LVAVFSKLVYEGARTWRINTYQHREAQTALFGRASDYLNNVFSLLQKVPDRDLAGF